MAIDYSSCPMMGSYYAGNYGWIFGWIFMALASVALVLLIIWLVKQLNGKKR